MDRERSYLISGFWYLLSISGGLVLVQFFCKCSRDMKKFVFCICYCGKPKTTTSKSLVALCIIKNLFTSSSIV